MAQTGVCRGDSLSREALVGGQARQRWPGQGCTWTSRFGRGQRAERPRRTSFLRPEKQGKGPGSPDSKGLHACCLCSKGQSPGLSQRNGPTGTDATIVGPDPKPFAEERAVWLPLYPAAWLGKGVQAHRLSMVALSFLGTSQ